MDLRGGWSGDRLPASVAFVGPRSGPVGEARDADAGAWMLSCASWSYRKLRCQNITRDRARARSSHSAHSDVAHVSSSPFHRGAPFSPPPCRWPSSAATGATYRSTRRPPNASHSLKPRAWSKSPWKTSRGACRTSTLPSAASRPAVGRRGHMCWCTTECIRDLGIGLGRHRL